MSTTVTSLTSYLSDAFFEGLLGVGARQNFDARASLNLMLFESGVKPWSIHPTAPASGIYGQMFKTREEAEDFAQLSAEEQLASYERYMATYRNVDKPDAANLYQLNFLPASLVPGSPYYRGSSPDTVLAARGGTGYGGQEDNFYRSNTVLDRDRDGKITVADLGKTLEAAREANAAKWAELEGRLIDAGYEPRSRFFSSVLPTVLLLAAVGGSVWYATRRL